ncbi:MAG: hypothetical protein FJX47_12465, partial [Alphaproteobacteria bacterium]|nr:hypothetical protein [Alphaproteobacteria bacterium]
MKFERVPVASAVGAVLAHGAGAPGRMRKKGHVLAAADVEEMAKAGITHVMVARLEPGDVAEDAAAARLARAIQGAGITAAAPFTGR